jgi:hypothetical protein
LHPFIETVSVAGGIAAAIVGAVIILTLFYRGLTWLTKGAKPDPLEVAGILKKNTLANVHVAGHKPFERVRFLGYTNSESMKTHLPWELNGMVILEDESQARFLVRAKDIKMIEIPSEGESAALDQESF